MFGDQLESTLKPSQFLEGSLSLRFLSTFAISFSMPVLFGFSHLSSPFLLFFSLLLPQPSSFSVFPFEPFAKRMNDQDCHKFDSRICYDDHHAISVGFHRFIPGTMTLKFNFVIWKFFQANASFGWSLCWDSSYVTPCNKNKNYNTCTISS